MAIFRVIFDVKVTSTSEGSLPKITLQILGAIAAWKGRRSLFSEFSSFSSGAARIQCGTRVMFKSQTRTGNRNCWNRFFVLPRQQNIGVKHFWVRESEIGDELRLTASAWGDITIFANYHEQNHHCCKRGEKILAPKTRCNQGT